MGHPGRHECSIGDCAGARARIEGDVVAADYQHAWCRQLLVGLDPFCAGVAAALHGRAQVTAHASRYVNESCSQLEQRAIQSLGSNAKCMRISTCHAAYAVATSSRRQRVCSIAAASTVHPVCCRASINTQIKHALPPITTRHYLAHAPVRAHACARPAAAAAAAAPPSGCAAAHGHHVAHLCFERALALRACFILGRLRVVTHLHCEALRTACKCSPLYCGSRCTASSALRKMVRFESTGCMLLTHG